MTNAQAHAANPETRKPRRAGFFAPIEDLPSARSAARSGAAAGLISAALYALSLVILTRATRTPESGSQIDLQEDLLSIVLADWIIVTAILFLSWRVGTSRGHISAIILLAWSAIMAPAVIADGKMPLLSGILYLSILAGMVNGIRGCWKARKFRALAKMVERF